LTKRGFKIVQEGNKIEIQANGKTHIIGIRKGSIYELAIRIKGEQINPSYFSNKEKETEDNALRWHLRLGHVSKDKMKLLVKNNLVTGLTRTDIPDFTCEGCILGRMTRKPYGTPSTKETTPGSC
jgi:hypothetical protein